MILQYAGAACIVQAAIGISRHVIQMRMHQYQASGRFRRRERCCVVGSRSNDAVIDRASPDSTSFTSRALTHQDRVCGSVGDI